MSEKKPLCKLCRERHWMREPHVLGKVTESPSKVTKLAPESKVTAEVRLQGKVTWAESKQKAWEDRNRDRVRQQRKEYMKRYRANTLNAVIVQPKPSKPVESPPLVDAVSPSISREGYGKASSTVKPKGLIMEGNRIVGVNEVQPPVYNPNVQYQPGEMMRSPRGKMIETTVLDADGYEP